MQSNKPTTKLNQQPKFEQCNICKQSMILESHHIWSTCYGGPNIDWNKCRICPNCHKKIHNGLIVVEGWFSTTGKKGRTLIWRNKDEESITEMPDPKVWLYGDLNDKESVTENLSEIG